MKTKKMLSLLLSFVLTLALFPMTALAADETDAADAELYTVTVSETKNGSVSLSATTAPEGGRIGITVQPDKGYTLEILNATDSKGETLEITIVEIGREYYFMMPASDAALEVTFMEDNTMLNYFVDVNARDYYYDAVLWAATNGVADSTDSMFFKPNEVCTRAQAVTFLWRAAGSPVVNYAMNMTDVPSDAYYAEAVRWALSQGITTGVTDTTFAPNEGCTRAQAMTFLYRSAQAQGKEMQGAWMFQNPFTDVALDSYYGEAVMWAVANKVTEGVGGGLFGPNEDCTRAQSVTFLWRVYSRQ